MNEAPLTWAIIVVSLLSLWLGSLIVRRRRTPLDLRPILAYRILPQLIDEAVESDRSPHFSLGSSAVGRSSTLTALASADVMYYLVRRFSFGKRLPIVTLSDPVTLAVASDTLRRAYIARDNLGAFSPTAVAWFPHEDRSLAFAAGAASFASDAGATSHILLGTFGTELALFGELSTRRNQRLIAHSTAIQGQAIAFVMADTPLIGEELFVGSAYLNRRDPIREGGLVALDILRWGVIVFGILLAIIVNAVE